VTAVRLPPEGDSQDDRAFFTGRNSTTLTGSDPLTRGDSFPPVGKQPGPNGMNRSAPDSFYELVAR
jgi:hypothetical protein